MSDHIKIREKWIPAKRMKPLVDYAFDTKDPVNTLSVDNLKSYPKAIGIPLRQLSKIFTDKIIPISRITINLVDEDLYFPDKDTVFLPLGKGIVFANGDGSEIHIEYLDRIVIKDSTSGVTFRAPERAYYLYGFHSDVPIKRTEENVTTDVASKCRFRNRNWYSWLKVAPSKDFECYKYILNNMNNFKSLRIIEDSDIVFTEDEIIKAEKAFFVYTSLILAVRRSYLDVLDQLLNDTFLDYQLMSDVIERSQYFDQSSDLPSSHVEMLNIILHNVVASMKYSVLNVLIPKFAFDDNLLYSVLSNVLNIKKSNIRDSILPYLSTKRKMKYFLRAVPEGRYDIANFMLSNLNNEEIEGVLSYLIFYNTSEDPMNKEGLRAADYLMRSKYLSVDEKCISIAKAFEKYSLMSGYISPDIKEYLQSLRQIYPEEVCRVGASGVSESFQVMNSSDISLKIHRNFIFKEDINRMYDIADDSLAWWDFEYFSSFEEQRDLIPIGNKLDLIEPRKTKYSNFAIYKFKEHVFTNPLSGDDDLEGGYVFLDNVEVTLSDGQSVILREGDLIYPKYIYTYNDDDVNESVEKPMKFKSLSNDELYVYRIINLEDKDDTFTSLWADKLRLRNFKGLRRNANIDGPQICDLRLSHGLSVKPYSFIRKSGLLTYANYMDIDYQHMGNEEILDAIKTKAPCNWITQVHLWSRTSSLTKYLNRYSYYVGMSHLLNYREGGRFGPPDDDLADDDYSEDNKIVKSYKNYSVGKAVEFFYNLGTAIYSGPRTDESFTVLRGIYGKKYNTGEIVTFSAPSSATFDPQVAEFYAKDRGCCIMKIFIPIGATLGYHPSEDQVIFPSGSKLYILNDLNSGTGSNVYNAIYIDVPYAPVGESIVKVVDGSFQENFFREKMDRNEPFPYRL